MTYKQALKHYKTQSAMARALNVDRQVVHNWAKRGISEAGQLRIQIDTAGKLMADVKK